MKRNPLRKKCLCTRSIFTLVFRLRVLLFCLLAVWFCSVSSVAAAEAVGWKAGVAKAVITPEKPVWLAGYGSKRPPDGKLHDLWMKALALEDNVGRRVVLITSDFQGVPKMMSDRVFDLLQKQFKLERTQVMFTFSHNHCGPRIRKTTRFDMAKQLTRPLRTTKGCPECRLNLGAAGGGRWQAR